MYLIVGLGNIGKEYEGTRHNIGFEVIDYLCKEHNIQINKTKFKADYTKTRLAGEEVFLVKPRTYMNLSGESVKLFRDYFKIEDENIFIIYDDIELPLGKLRIRKSGGPGTHNGMKSIVKELGTRNFPRFRLGVGSPEHGDLINHVLGRFYDDEKKEVETLIKTAAKAVYDTLDKDIDKAMNMHNKK